MKTRQIMKTTLVLGLALLFHQTAAPCSRLGGRVGHRLGGPGNALCKSSTRTMTNAVGGRDRRCSGQAKGT